MEKQLLLDGIDPLDFYGVNNSKINLIKSYFPNIKITERGNTIHIKGADQQLSNFELRFAAILSHYHQYNNLNDEAIHKILGGQTKLPVEDSNLDKKVILFGNNGKPIRAKTPNQQKLKEASEKNDLLFAIGPAGSGKTYTAIALAVKALKNREIRKIILSRPAVEAGENLGFLPGDLKEKIDPYLQPLYDALMDMIPAKKLEEFLKDGTIQIAPLAFMRGRTLSNAYVVLDEAQNTTVNQLKMFLTRMGINAKFIITGDVTQIDLPKSSHSGLLNALKILKNVKGISTIYFDKKDIVRHKLVRDIVDAYEKNTTELENKHNQKEKK